MKTHELKQDCPSASLKTMNQPGPARPDHDTLFLKSIKDREVKF